VPAPDTGVIDLHLHTTASDGACPPADLLARAAAAGVGTLSVTDHDTMAAVPEALALAASHELEVLPGIEITAVRDGRDVHILGYFLAPSPPGLDAFLEGQRGHRADRLRAMADRLSAQGFGVDIEALLAARAVDGRSLGRPHLAQALVAAGHVRSVQEAFDRWLGDGRATWVERQGETPERVVEAIAEAGGVASLAHPGLSRDRRLLGRLAEAGLDAVEVYHSQHDAPTRRRLLDQARSLNLAATGGSDFHGDTDHRAGHLGRVGVPPEAYAELRERMARAASRIEST
tara:strand:+ start:1782 stop:2648 length:867 start_codon:yes stop_codon:yes gene_type:complete